MSTMKVLLAATALTTFGASAATAATLEDVKQKGFVQCGVSTGVPGFSFTDDAGNFVIRNPADFGNFPYDTHVTACGSNPEQKPKITLISSAAEGNCSLAGSCHGAGGGAGLIDIPDPI